MVWSKWDELNRRIILLKRIEGCRLSKDLDCTTKYIESSDSSSVSWCRLFFFTRKRERCTIQNTKTPTRSRLLYWSFKPGFLLLVDFWVVCIAQMHMRWTLNSSVINSECIDVFSTIYYHAGKGRRYYYKKRRLILLTLSEHFRYIAIYRGSEGWWILKMMKF